MNSTMRIAVPNISFCRNETLRRELLDAFSDVRFNDTSQRLGEDDLVAFLSDRDAAIMGLEPLTEPMLEVLPDLKVISRMGVGVDNVDPDLLNRFGIRIGWTGGTNRHSVAELAICFAIAGLRHVAPLNFEMRSGNRPRARMGRHLRGRTVGIHGCGNVGKEVVKLLAPFDCTVLACDVRDMAAFHAEHGVEAVSMDELVARSEVLTIHLPLNETTKDLYAADVLNRLRPDCVLVNTCRGGIVDEAALEACLGDGRIAAACFDVFAVEPPIDQALLNAPNFLCTPHIGGSAEEALLAMGRAAISGLAETMVPRRGAPPFD